MRPRECIVTSPRPGRCCRDPKLAAEVMNDPEIRHASMRAAHDAVLDQTGRQAPERRRDPQPKAAKHSANMVDETQLEIYELEALEAGRKYIEALASCDPLKGEQRQCAIDGVNEVITTWTAARDAIDSNVGDAAAEWLASQ